MKPISSRNKISNALNSSAFELGINDIVDVPISPAKKKLKISKSSTPNYLKDTVNSSFHWLSPTSVSPLKKKNKVTKPATPILAAHIILVPTVAFEELSVPIVGVLDLPVERSPQFFQDIIEELAAPKVLDSTAMVVKKKTDRYKSTS